MNVRQRLAGLTEGLCFLLVLAAFVAIQVLIGGTRMVFSLPSYIALGCAGLIAVFAFRRGKPAAGQLCLAVTALAFGYILARALLSPVPYIARSDLYSVLAGLVVYFITACVLTSGRQRLAFVVCLLVLGIAHVCVGALQFRDGSNFMPISWLQRYDYGARASGFYVCPNHLAGLLEILGIFGLSAVCWSRWPVWSKLLIGYAVAVCYVGLVLTGSRGGYLSAAASLLVFGVLSLIVLRHTPGAFFWKITGPALVAIIIVGATLVFAVGKSHSLSERAQNTFDMHNMRLDLWQSALQQWKLRPIVGTGSATYLYYGRMFRTERVQADPIYPHNDYLQLLAEYGLLGAIALGLFVAVHLWHGAESFRRLGPKRVAIAPRLLSNALALNIGALGAVASYLVHSALDFNLHIPANFLLMAFVMGVLANEGVSRESSSARALRAHQVWQMGLLPALGLLLLVPAARLLPGEYFAERARGALRDGQSIAATHFAHRGLEFDRANPDLHFYLGLAQIATGAQFDDPLAVASFNREGTVALEKARTLVREENLYAIELASTLDAQQRFEEAEWVWEEALRQDPRSSSVRRYYDRHLGLWRGDSPAEVPPTPPESAGQ